jgi:two-component system sensor histidine kinase HydH
MSAVDAAAELFVVGAAPEIRPDLSQAPIVRVSAGMDVDASPLAAVFDLRAASVAELAVMRARTTLAAVPLLLLSSVEIPEAAFALLRADDGFVFGRETGATLRRRIANLLEIGRGRRDSSEHQRFERLAAMGTMVAGFAHEVRNPVAAMRSIAEELAEELRDAGVTMPHLGLMLQMLERIERLVRTSLQFGRPAAPKRAPQRPKVIVSSAIAELHPRLRGRGDELVVEIDRDLPDVNVDERQLAQALVILLQNALDATSDPSRVRMRVRRGRPMESEGRMRTSEPPSATVRFEVIDNGPGIPANLVGRIFDPFFTTKPSGTGLGLSIAQQIVSENGARLEVSSTAGSTTSFSIVVPT